jgi:hypothetical protein
MQIEEHLNSDLSFSVDPLDVGFPLARAIGDISSSYRDKTVLTRTSELEKLDTISLDISKDIFVCSQPTYSEPGFLLPPERSLPSQEERMAMYKSLDDLLGPACGVEEYVGTYRKHMQERSHLYFERLFGNSGATWDHTGLPLKTDSLTSIRKDRVDFRKWLLCDTAGRVDSQLRSISNTILPSSTPRKRGQESGDKTTAPSVTDCDNRGPLFCFSPRIDRSDEQTLDDLFPKPPSDLQCLVDTPDSPLLRASAPCSSLSGEKERSQFAGRRKPKALLRLADSKPSPSRERRDRSLLSPPCLLPRDQRARKSQSTGYKRSRNANMPSPPAVSFRSLEEANFEEHIPYSVNSMLDRMSANRDSKFLRPRSNSTISARLRTTSAGGGI